jgi:hypothetical protein
LKNNNFKYNDLAKVFFNNLIKEDEAAVFKLFDVEEHSYHNGFEIKDFVISEIEQFNKSCPYYNLKPDEFHVDLTGNIGKKYFFSVINSEGQFVFEYGLNINDGKIIPDNSHYQVVPKFIFNNKKPSRRAFALWCPDNIQSPNAVIPKNFIAQEPEYNFTASTLTDGFYSYNFYLDRDDYKEKLLKFRFIDKFFPESIELRFPGKEHPYFFDNMFPVIDKNKVIIPKVNSLVWSIAVFFEDETDIHMEFPREKTILFNKDIKKVVLTDALDNDWEVKKDFYE